MACQNIVWEKDRREKVRKDECSTKKIVIDNDRMPKKIVWDKCHMGKMVVSGQPLSRWTTSTRTG